MRQLDGRGCLPPSAYRRPRGGDSRSGPSRPKGPCWRQRDKFGTAVTKCLPSSSVLGASAAVKTKDSLGNRAPSARCPRPRRPGPAGPALTAGTSPESHSSSRAEDQALQVVQRWVAGVGVGGGFGMGVSGAGFGMGWVGLVLAWGWGWALAEEAGRNSHGALGRSGLPRR